MSDKSRSPSRRHGRKTFFKYMPLKTAEIVLSTQKLRWSSPLNFNDPFDVPRKLFPDASPNAIREHMARDMLQIISNPPLDDADFCEEYRQLISVARRFNGVIPEDIQAKMVSEALKDATSEDTATSGLRELQEHWERTFESPSLP